MSTASLYKVYESVAVKMITDQGYALAVGCICLPGTSGFWAERFQILKKLKIAKDDIYIIDYVLARALKIISNESLLLAGCTLDTGAALSPKESTGGVLGCPQNDICSAAGESEILPDGFSMYSAPGGPGLAAQADPITVEGTAKAIQMLGRDRADGRKILELLKSAGIDTCLLVCDGTGSQAQGCLAALSPAKQEIIYLGRAEK